MAPNKDIATTDRRRRVRDIILRGGAYTQGDIARRLGVSDKTISQDIRWIWKQWEEEDAAWSKVAKQKRIRQLEISAQEAMDSFERSKENQEEVTTTYHPRTCKACKGSGMVEGTEKWCPECGGEGKVLSEVVTRKVKGSPGDVGYLRAFNEAVREMSRLEDHYNYAGVGRPRNEVVEKHLHLHQHKLDLSGVSSEVLLEAKGAMERLREAAGANGKVITVESKEGKKDED